MDCQMPEVDGYAAAREIRNRGHALPIVALTAHAMTTHRAQSLDAGMNDHLSKPFERSELSAMLDKWLPERASTPGATPGSLLRPDRNALVTRLGGDERLADELIEAFLESAPVLAARVRAELAAGRVPDAARASHSLKGAAAAVHATALASLAAEIETALKKGEPAEGRIDELVGELERATGTETH